MREQLVNNYQNVKFGADPEGFFQNEKGLIVGSELVIPRKLKYGDAEVVRDGVQFELHYRNPQFCREVFAQDVASGFEALKARLEKLEGIFLCYKPVVRVTAGEMKKLSPESRQLGCAPSVNIYDDDAKLGINPHTYKIRSAGGHVHLGLSVPRLKSEFRRIVRMEDVLLGNQCVLMDRDPLMKLRRRVYGRAGECRPQKYGFEYRTLSNFWLRSEPLVSFVLGMARKAVQVIATTDGVAGIEPFNFEREVFTTYGVKIADIIEAINTNDFDLAYSNYEKIEKFLVECFDRDADCINKDNYKKFRKFALGIRKKGLESYFPVEPMKYWTEDHHNKRGFESFLSHEV